MENENKEKSIAKEVGSIVGTIGGWFLSSAFILWGWNTIAARTSLPFVTYWEVFAVRMAFSSMVAICRQK